ncbi:helix-turn-helix domain-containing protein [Streptomyces sp. PR69]|uniref:helix-turn-helix domain-containing protein n=1 Tax=Streptomyces sp. PR69 TaxID=2984950 RepID=UPI00226468BB|nr:XRE family transcriptional regulator [Streptomyces sp. PR69]
MRDSRGSGDLPPAAECEQLAAELRALREAAGLSLAELAARTPYSKSSWERYVNGRKPVPRQAVEALCAVAKVPAGRLLALWELADAAWSGRARPASAPESPAPSAAAPAERPSQQGLAASDDTAGSLAGERPRRRGRVRLTVAAAALGLAAAVAVPFGLAGEGSDSAEAENSPGPIAAPAGPGCVAEECEGKAPLPMRCGAPGKRENLATARGRDGQRIELRFALDCRTVWVRATWLEVGDRVLLTVPGATPKEVRARDERDAARYLVTPMTAVESPDGARACLHPADGAEQVCIP